MRIQNRIIIKFFNNMKQMTHELDDHRPRFKHSYKIKPDRSQLAVSPPKLSLKIQRKYEQRTLPKVVIKQLNQTEFINNSAVLKTQQSYRDGQSWRLSSIHSDRPAARRKVSKQEILRHASLSNKKQGIVFKNEAIKSRLLQKIQNNPRYLQPTELKIHSYSSKAKLLVPQTEQSNRLSQINDITQIGLPSQGNPTVFFNNSFFKTKEFNRMLSKRVKLILGFKRDS